MHGAGLTQGHGCCGQAFLAFLNGRSLAAVAHRDGQPHGREITAAGVGSAQAPLRLGRLPGIVLRVILGDRQYQIGGVFVLATTRPLAHPALAAFATARGRDLDAVLAHVPQQQVNCTDSGGEQCKGNDDGKHGQGPELLGAPTISQRMLRIQATRRGMSALAARRGPV